MGEYDLNKKSIVQKNKQSSSYIDSKSKKEATCGCMGNGCLIFWYYLIKQTQSLSMNKSLNVTKKQSIKPTPFFASTAYHDIN